MFANLVSERKKVDDVHKKTFKMVCCFFPWGKNSLKGRKLFFRLNIKGEGTVVCCVEKVTKDDLCKNIAKIHDFFLTWESSKVRMVRIRREL